MEKKMTKKEMFMEMLPILEDCERYDLMEMVNHEIDLLNKKASKPNKADKEKTDNKELVYKVVASMGKPTCINDLIATGELEPLANEYGVITPQKVSAYLKLLKDEKRVDKTDIKKKAYFFAL